MTEEFSNGHSQRLSACNFLSLISTTFIIFSNKSLAGFLFKLLQSSRRQKPEMALDFCVLPLFGPAGLDPKSSGLTIRLPRIPKAYNSLFKYLFMRKVLFKDSYCSSLLEHVLETLAVIIFYYAAWKNPDCTKKLFPILSTNARTKIF